MPQNYFITGTPKAGKTTLIRKLVKELKKKGLKVGGFISPEEKHHGTRTAFHVIDIETGKKAILASVKGDGPKVSKYHVNVRSFENTVLPAMRKCNKYDVFVIDEIGRMEMKSRKFVNMLDEVFESKTPLVASLHRDYVGKYKFSGEVFNLGGNDHELVYVRLLRKARTGLVKKPKKKVKKKPAKKKTKKLKKTKTKKKMKKKKVSKKAVKKEKRTVSSKEARKKAMEELRGEEPEEYKEEEGFFGKIKDLLGV